MKVTVTLGDAGFEAEADATEREMMLVLYRLWLNAMESSGADAVKLEALTTRLRTQNDALAAAVAGVSTQENL
jgi:hypothetical protein